MRAMFIAVALILIPTALVASQATRAVLYAPFGIDGGLRAGFNATSAVRGSCWTQSLSSARPDAWRCMTGNFIHDPCFSNGAMTKVACPDNAFSKTLLVITLDKPLPKHEGPSEPTPWALRLSNGARCGLATGATGVIAGMRLNYGCSPKGWVLGDVERATQPWRVYFTTDIDKADYVQVDVSEAVL